MMWELYFLFHVLLLYLFNDVVATASEQDGMAVAIISK